MSVQAQLSDDRACERFYDARYAAGYMDDWPAGKLQRVREVLAALELPEAGTAVDFGCGNGTMTAVLREALPAWHIVGLDVSRVALEHARQTVPDCAFHHLDERAGGAYLDETDAPLSERSRVVAGTVDFLFTHHVLEHVNDLQRTWTRMAGLMRERSWMLHILPCGDPGSLEHELCRLRRDGIDSSNGRFFYEDPSHLRRLRTQEMVASAGRFGYALADAFYSHHHIEAIDWLSGNGVRFVLDLCDPTQAVDEPAKRRLARIRRQLLGMSVIKRVARSRGLGARPLAAIAQRLSQRWARQSDREWQALRSHPGGSEMYLVFHRAGGSQT